MSQLILFQLSYSSSGSQVATAYPGSSGHKVGPNPRQDPLPSQGHSHTHPYSLRLRQCRHANSPNVRIFGTWREMKESLEKIHADMRRIANYTDSGLAGNHFFFLLLISDIMKQCWKKYHSRTCCTILGQFMQCQAFIRNIFWAPKMRLNKTWFLTSWNW